MEKFLQQAFGSGPGGSPVKPSARPQSAAVGRARQPPLAQLRVRIEELELTVLNRQDVIQHLNKDVEKMVSQLADLGRLKAEGQQHAQRQLAELTANLNKATDARNRLQQEATSLQTAVSQQKQEAAALKAELEAELEAARSKASSDQAALAAEIAGLQDRLQSAETQLQA
ncbi:hypothetical protein WJX73_001338 [Symbiochloris irregularis]|uniref:Uncharacterized protein n=1 Tax=Symbiochloris irregularis TaxID=706552 RepID=A0AAW1NVX6_9CHLO